MSTTADPTVRQRSTAGPQVTDIAENVSLVEAARAGNREAFGLLYHRYARMVHGVLLARLSFSDVDDLVQEVFLLALRRLSSLRDASAFGAWLARIARNRATDHYRQSRETTELPDDLAAPDGAETEGRLALAAIRTLPETYRETLMLRLVEGLTGPEIAERLGMTHGSVRVNLSRGMKQLREKLGRSEAHE